MRIAYLTSKYPAISHTFILREVLALRERGFDIRTFTIRRAKPNEYAGSEAEQEVASTAALLPVHPLRWLKALLWAVFVHPVLTLQVLRIAVARKGLTVYQRCMGLAYFLEALVLAHWLYTEQVQHLHVHFGNNGSTTGMLAAKLVGLPFSFTVHASELLEAGYHRLCEKVAAAVFVACVSRFGRAQLMAVCDPRHWDRLQIVRCGLPLSEIPPAHPEVLRSRQSANKPLRMLCVARLCWQKGHMVLLEALKQLKERNVNFTCTLIGDGPLRKQLEHRRADLGLTEEVCLAGAMSLDQVRAAYEHTDVAILASFSEGVPVAAMEAMARGKPMIATSVSGVPELIEHDVTGYLVPPGDPTALADAVQHLWQHPTTAERLGIAGRSRVQQEFSLERNADILAGLFRGARSSMLGKVTGTHSGNLWPFATRLSS